MDTEDIDVMVVDIQTEGTMVDTDMAMEQRTDTEIVIPVQMPQVFRGIAAAKGKYQ